MTLTLELSQELEQELRNEADRAGLPLNEYAIRLLATARPAQPMPTTGAALVSYWQSEGLLGLRVEINDSQAHARRLRLQAEQRSQE